MPAKRFSRSVTSHDVAAAAGVSQPTVSRALRGDPRLSAETRGRVLEAAADLQYIPSQRGRSLSTRSAGQVGIVVRDLENLFSLEILAALHTALADAEERMIVLTPDEEDSVPLTRLLDGSLDGVILTTERLTSTLPRRLADKGFPFVLLNREVEGSLGDACVVDNQGGAALVARELLELGHRRIAAIFGLASTSTGRDRERGFGRELAVAGVALADEQVRRGAFTFDVGYRFTLELLAVEAARPTALFCANDMIALGAFNAIRALGLRVPRDITLIGFDDLRVGGWEVFELTTVSQNLGKMVAVATGLLLSRIDAASANADAAPVPPRRVVLPAQLVRRGTHGPPRERYVG